MVQHKAVGGATWGDTDRRRSALVVTDLVESVRMMQADETDVIQRWLQFVQIARDEVLPRHGARMVKSLGDGMLIEAGDAASAVAVALDLHRSIERVNTGRPGEQRFFLRSAAHLAEVIVDQLDLYGAGVNLAHRLVSLGEPGDIVVSAEIRDRLTNALHVSVEDLGLCYVKHVERPERAFRIKPPDPSTSALVPLRPAPLGPALTDAAVPTVAIVPLQAIHGDKPSAVCGQLVADAVIARLSRNPMLRVISRLSTTVLRDHPFLEQAAREHFNATYVATGHCITEGGLVSLHVELADLRSHSVQWADRFNCPVSELIGADSHTLHELAAAIHLAIVEAELQRIRSLPFPSLETFSLLLGSMSLLHRASTRDFQRAQQALQAFIDRAPRHASGYALKSQWHVLQLNRGLSTAPDKDRRLARQDSERAVACDPDSSTAQTCRGLVLGFLDHDLPAAGRCYEAALAVNPNEPMAWLFTATLRSWQCRGKEAAEAAERALLLSPLDPQRYYYDSLAATAVLADDQFDRAIALAKRSLRANRLHTSSYRVLAIAQVLSGDGDSARATVRQLLSLEGGLTVSGYLARYPGRGTAQAEQYGRALAEAGLPP